MKDDLTSKFKHRVNQYILKKNIEKVLNKAVLRIHSYSHVTHLCCVFYMIDRAQHSLFSLCHKMILFGIIIYILAI